MYAVTIPQTGAYRLATRGARPVPRRRFGSTDERMYELEMLGFGGATSALMRVAIDLIIHRVMRECSM